MREDNREVAQGFSPRRATSDFSHVMDEVSSARTTDQRFWQNLSDTINRQTNLGDLGFPTNFQISGQQIITTGGGERAQQRGTDGTRQIGAEASNREGQPRGNETRLFDFDRRGNAIYTLRAGDNLSHIARDLLTQHRGQAPDNVAITRAAAEIARINNIRPDTIYYPGQQLVIPMWMRSLTHGEIPQREITLSPNSPGARAEQQARRDQTETPAGTGRGERPSQPGQRQRTEGQPQGAAGGGEGGRERQRGGQHHRRPGHGAGGRRAHGGAERSQGGGGRGHGSPESQAVRRRGRGQAPADQRPTQPETAPSGDAPPPNAEAPTVDTPAAVQETPASLGQVQREAIPDGLSNPAEQPISRGVIYPESGPTRGVAEGLAEATRPRGDVFHPLTPPGQAGPIVGRMTEFDPPINIRFDNGQGGSIDVAGVSRVYSRHVPGTNGEPDSYTSTISTNNGPMRFRMDGRGRVIDAPRVLR